MLSMRKKGDILKFAKTSFIYEERLGEGGTGDTHLVKDTTADMYFAIKKYVPKNETFREEHYRRFVDEIKILFQLSHINIVRIYNYYLYPKKQTGFIQMEYVNGSPIDKYFSFSTDDLENIFIQSINGFHNLEQNGILHRDVRPANILVTKDNIVKIIDFGFGKKLEDKNDVGDSVLLNWPVSEFPDEILEDGKYTHQTDIFFVGKLFRKILSEQDYWSNFKYDHIVDKMTYTNPNKRFTSFAEILETISSGVLHEIQFLDREKKVYQSFADALLSHVLRLHNPFTGTYDIPQILNSLEAILKENALEKFIQNNEKLISSFIRVGCRIINPIDIEVVVVRQFYELLKGKPNNFQKVILDNLYNRIRTLPLQEDDGLPF